MNRRSFIKTTIGTLAGIAVLPRLGKYTKPEESISSSDSVNVTASTSLPVPCRSCSSVCTAKDFWQMYPEHLVGTRYVSPCGRTFRYVQWGKSGLPPWKIEDFEKEPT